MGDKNTLWAVRRAGATHHLLGSVHSLKEEDYPLAPAIERAYDSARVVLVEADLDGIPEEELGRMFVNRGRYGEGDSLRANVSGETYALLRARAAELGLDMRELDRIRPWFLTIILTTLVGTRMGLDAERGVDKFFLRRAREDGKVLLCLESVEDQVNFLGDVPPEVQELTLLNALKAFDEIPGKLERINRAWARGDVAELEALLVENSAEYPEINESLIHARTANWQPRVEACLDHDRSHLVVVGAAHLVGERGILRALADRGYDVRQL